MLAFLFTAAADYFLAALESPRLLPGMACFLGAQLCWASRLFSTESMQKRRAHITVFLIAVFVFGLSVILITRSADVLMLICCLYFSLLLSTALFSWITPKNILFAVGMTLFVGCDLFVIANNASAFLTDISAYPVLERMSGIPFNMMWLFYGPSQTLLSLSSRD